MATPTRGCYTRVVGRNAFQMEPLSAFQAHIWEPSEFSDDVCSFSTSFKKNGILQLVQLAM